jgi:hypothetical protein
LDVSSLERVAHSILHLQHQVTQSSSHQQLAENTSTSNIPSMHHAPANTEYAAATMALHGRIQTLQAQTVQTLLYKYESLLKDLNQEAVNQEEVPQDTEPQNELLQQLAPTLRALVLLSQTDQVEHTFARLAVMPLLKKLLNMGRLDQGGLRGSCQGLPGVLKEFVQNVHQTYGSAIVLAYQQLQLDLVTGGVWVPLATTFLTDKSLQMALFSPGLADTLQHNYKTMDDFLHSLPKQFLENDAQVERGLYQHQKTKEFYKHWNLPIYYQLRFGDACTELNAAVDQTMRDGWTSEEDVLVFQTLQTLLQRFWQSHIYLQPLCHRFLRGALQLLERVIAFVRLGLEGQIEFGGQEDEEDKGEADESDFPRVFSTTAPGSSSVLDSPAKLKPVRRDPYKWCDRLEDVALVAWELTLLENWLKEDYIPSVQSVVNDEELQPLVQQVLEEAVQPIPSLVESAWNEVIVKLLVQKCSSPLAAVKGVAATYRMTNRPPPTQASPYVGTILRPLMQFTTDFKHQIPLSVTSRWKLECISQVSQRYAVSVQELLTTVQRTEVALQSRRRRVTSDGMSDGDKVKLQLYLDYQGFCNAITEVGVDPDAVEGVSKLEALTKQQQQDNEN